MKKLNFKQKLALLLTGSLVVGMISAYFTDADTATNTFTVGDVSMNLQEPNWDPDAADEILPSQTVPKDPQILNNGENEEFVFATVEVPYVKDLITVNPDGTKNEAADTDLFTYEVNDGWVEIGTPVVNEEKGTVTYTYAYGTDTEMEALLPGESTPALFDEVTFVNAAEKQDLENTSKDIVINGYAIQTDNINGGKTAPADVWQVVQNQDPDTTEPTNPPASSYFTYDFAVENIYEPKRETPYGENVVIHGYALQDVVNANEDETPNLLVDEETGVISYTPDDAMGDTVTATLVTLYTSDKKENITEAYEYITIEPASNVLYEDTFISPVGGAETYSDWSLSRRIEAQAVTDNETTVFGYTDAYQNSFGESGAYTVHVDDNNETNIPRFTTDLSFEFYGTGFDIIGTCDLNTGTLMVRLNNKDTGAFVRAYIADTSFDDSAFSTIQQVPLIHEGSLEEGSYTLTIRGAYVFNSASPTAEKPESMYLEVDGIRVYRSTDNENYPETEKGIIYTNVMDCVEGSLTAYIEGGNTGNLEITDYENAGGPQFEIYLEKGSAIAIQTTDTSGYAQVSAKMVGTEAAILNDGTNAVEVAHNTEMYYEVEVAEDGMIIIGNTGNGMLAISNIKSFGTVTAINSDDEALVLERVAQMMN